MNWRKDCTKCGPDTVSYHSLDRKSDPLHEGYYKCKSCGYVRMIKRKQYKNKPAVPKTDTTTNLTDLQIGRGVTAYIGKLLQENRELKSCLVERDELQAKLNQMQEKYNAMKLTGTQRTSIPSKMF